MGIDHERFTYRHQGLDFRLTGVEPAKVVKGSSRKRGARLREGALTREDTWAR
jgi:hypothetical protein